MARAPGAISGRVRARGHPRACDGPL